MHCMTVGELRALLNNLPDDMSILTPIRGEKMDGPLRSVAVRNVEVIMHRRTQEPLYILPSSMKHDRLIGVESRSCLFLG